MLPYKRLIGGAMWLSACALWAAGPAGETNEIRRLTIPRLEDNGSSPMTLDGRMDEPRWARAAAIPGFVSVWGKGGGPALQTEARLFYDGRFLYAGLVFHEARMARIVMGIPPDQAVDAPISSSDDCCEMLIAPDGDPLRYFVLKFTPSGARNDAIASSRRAQGGSFNIDERWHGSWDVATWHGTDRWTAEVRIPLDLFVREGQFCGTPPAAGEVWRINLCRVASTRGEFSAWNPTPLGFQVPEHFGAVVFQGWEHGEIVVRDVDPGAFRYGTNRFAGTVVNASKRTASVRVAAQLVETLHAPEELTEAQRERLWEPPREKTDCLDAAFTMAPGETRPIAFTYAIAGGGAKRISLRVAWERMATTIFAGSAATNVYDLRTATRDQRRALETLSKQFAAVGRLEDYRTLVEAFGVRLEAARRQLTLIDAPGGDPNANIVRSRDLAGQIRDLRRRYANELAPAVWAVKTGVKDLDFCVGVVHPTDKVFRDDVFAGSLGDQVEIGLAANEYESAQFVILRLGDRPGRLVCSATDLVHADDAGAVIPAGRIEFAEVGYIQVGDTGKGTRSGAWPDILYPTNSVAYGQHDLQPVMLTVFAAPGQKPGRYMGRVTFANERGQALSMRLGVTVFDFELPRFRSLRSSFWFWVHRPRTYYGHRLEGAFFSVELYREFADILGRYQMAPSPRGDLMPRLIRLRRDAGGNVTFDFSGIDPYWKASIEAGANVLYIDRLGTNFFLKPEKSWQPHAVIVDDATGAEEDFVADDPERMADDYLRAVVRHFKARGWFDKAVTQVSDEPWSESKQRHIREVVAHLRAVAPDLPTVSAGTVKGRMNLDGHIDIWCPQFRQYDPADYAGMTDRERLWFYQCLYKPFYPTYTIDRPGIEPRIASLVCWKAGAEGFLYWTATMWDSDRIHSAKMKGDNRWIREDWMLPIKEAPGDGSFIYPQPHRLVASFRAQAIRDGFDDYEYLAILKERYERARKRGALTDEQRQAIEALLRLPDDIVKSPMNWTTSTAELERFRLKVAEWIQKL